jgi:hypothetical protein
MLSWGSILSLPSYVSGFWARHVTPYIVAPGRQFRNKTELGDVAVVVYRDRVATALVGDGGPCEEDRSEGTICPYELLSAAALDPCSEHDQKAADERAKASIGEDVLGFVFPRSAFDGGLNQENVEKRARKKATALFSKWNRDQRPECLPHRPLRIVYGNSNLRRPPTLAAA